MAKKCINDSVIQCFVPEIHPLRKNAVLENQFLFSFQLLGQFSTTVKKSFFLSIIVAAKGAIKDD